MQLMAGYSQTEKRAKLMLQAFAIGSKHGQRAFNRVTDANVLGIGGAIDLETDVELDKLFCPDVDKQITRSECLDYSGSTEHIEDCTSCDHFKETRELLKDK